jgi:hypothetical protein
VIEQIHQRMMELAVENQVLPVRRIRVDTTAVETNIHYPTDSSLLRPPQGLFDLYRMRLTQSPDPAHFSLKNLCAKK